MKEVHYCLGRSLHSSRQHLWLALSALFISLALLWGHPAQAADGSISGAVTNQASAGAAGINVELYMSVYEPSVGTYWQLVNSTPASETGEYTFTGLAAGNYRIGLIDNNFPSRYISEYYENKQTLETATTIVLADGENKSAINAQLAELGKITGTVTGPDGAPVENVPVVAYRNDGGSLYEINTVYTMADGSYAIFGLETGTYRIRYGTPFDANSAYSLEFYDNSATLELAADIAVTTGEATSGIDAQLALSGAIEGTVKNAAGELLPNIEVVLYREDPCCPGSIYQLTSIYTEESGTYHLPVNQPGTYRIGFFDQSGGTYAPAYYQGASTIESATDIVVGASETISGIDGEMVTFGSVAGTVTAPDGSPIPNLLVTIYTLAGDPCCGTYWNQYTSVSTDENGDYLLGGLAAGTYRIGFQDYNGLYQNEFYSDASTVETATDVVVGASEAVTGIDAQLANFGSISGTVTAPDGSPATNIAVSIYYIFDDPCCNSYWTQNYSVYTNENGDYLFSGLTADTYRIGFQDTNNIYQSEFYMDASTVETANDVVVGAGEAVTGIDVQLANFGSISGTVTAPDGSPIVNTNVSAYTFLEDSSYWNQSYSASTNENGEYLLGGLPAGTYRIGFQDYTGLYQNEFYSNASTLETATDVVVGVSESVTGIDAQLAVYSSISGTVTDESGNPLPNVYVYSHRIEPGSISTGNNVTTDEAGQYTLTGLASGTYRVSFSIINSPYIGEYYDDQPLIETATDILLGESESITGIDAALSLAGSITGTLTESSGNPLAQTRVVAYILTGGTPESSDAWQIYEIGYTDEVGQYRFSYLFPGTYRLKFGYEIPEEYAIEYYDNVATLEAATDILVATGETVTIDAQLKRVNGISGQVTDGSGNNLTNIDVGIYQKNATSTNRLETWDLVKSAVTGFDGYYEIRSLAPGSYRVGFSNGESLYHTEFYSNTYYLGDAQDILVGDEEFVDNINAQLEGISLNVRPKGRQDRMLITEASSSSLLDDQANSLLENDEDAEGKSLTATLVDLPEHGTLTLNPDGTFSYVHDGSETTEDHFTYMASDGVHMSELVTVTIAITPVNDAPVAVADALTVDQGGTATALTSGSSVLGNDSDAEGAALTAAVVEQPKHGTLTLNADGTFTYVHDGSDNLVDSFSYKVSDGTAESDAVQVAVQVNEPAGIDLLDERFLYLPLIN